MIPPEILESDVPIDMSRISQLIDDESVEVIDRLTHQVEELRKINAVTGEEIPENYPGCWVFFDWSKTLVRTLNRADFNKVRTNRNQNKITLSEQERLGEKRIGIIGMSVGRSIATTMAMERVFGHLKIADMDTLDLSNLNRLKAPIRDLGLKKTLSVQQELHELDPFLSIETLDEGITPENIDDLINYIENTALAMRNHLKNIIAFNKNKVEPVDIREIDVQELIDFNLKEFEPHPDFSELSVNMRIQQNAPFVSDRHRLNRILSNLISNVIKYRDVEKDTNELNIVAMADDNGLHLIVSDNGVGIKEENIDKISQIFFREPSSELGSGIGMYIVDQTAKKLKGNFELKSRKGEFTKYTFHFPSLEEKK